jgi:ribonuclease BN (tRNA processing enzyme)
MQIHCLGTTGYHPNASRHTACYYLRELGVMLDAGTGVCRLTSALQKRPTKDLDIVLSHAHLDHIVGLTFLLGVMSVTDLQRVRVYGQKDKLEAVRQNLYHKLLFPVPPDFDWHELPDESGQVSLANCTLDYFPQQHPGGSIGMLITGGGKRLAYLTDTTPHQDPEVISQLRDVDLLVHECYFNDESRDMAIMTGHSWLSGVTEFVQQTRPRRTLLIHVNPLVLESADEVKLTQRHRDLGIELAQDDAIYEY